MPTAHSKAEANWAGDLTSGGGSVRPESGAFPEVPVSWGRRIQRDPGTTSPEELIAAAHASCFSMALSNELAKVGTPPERLDVSADVAFVTGPGGADIASVDLDVVGRVPGSDSAAFAAATELARTGCPVSKALQNNVEIRVTARLDGGSTISPGG